MKLTIELPALKSILAKTASVVEKRTTIPILANIALKAYEGQLTALASDLDIEVTARADADVMQSGETTVPAHMFQSIVSKMPAGALVTLELDGHKLIVKAGRSKYQLETLPIEDFPAMAGHDYESEFKLQAGELSRMFNLTKFAMSTEETRYYLNGVYVHADDDRNIIAVSTDGHRLAKVTQSADVAFPGVIVPRKTVMEIVKASDIGEIAISVSQTKIKLDFGGTVIVSKVIDGTFPDYTRVIPVSNNKTMKASADEIKGASDRAILVADERSRAVRLDITADTVTLSTRGSVGHEATEIVDVSFDGEPMAIGFSSKYIADALSVCSGSDVTFKLNGPGDPAIIRPSDDAGVMFVVMPMRV